MILMLNLLYCADCEIYNTLRDSLSIALTFSISYTSVRTLNRSQVFVADHTKGTCQTRRKKSTFLFF